jgi:retinol dehydrogenase 12
MPTCFVTGTNTGIGRATADALAAHGATVILASRSADKTKPVLDALRARYPRAGHDFVPLDLADLAAVKRAATAYLASGRAIDVLINNAGRAGPGGLTSDGFEVTFGTNHLGPYALTELLLPALRAAPQGRIVNVSSNAQFMVKGAEEIDWAALQRPVSRRDSLKAYGVTKLMNVLYAKELARRLAGTRVTTYALHPGVVASDIWREVAWPIRTAIKLFMTSNAKGAETPVYCATAPELARVSGRYYVKCREATSNPVADDEALAGDLVARSEAAVASVLGAAWRT